MVNCATQPATVPFEEKMFMRNTLLAGCRVMNGTSQGLVVMGDLQ
jgi:hypothetical protein